MDSYIGKKYVNDYERVDPHDTVNMDFIVLASSLPEHRVESNKSEKGTKKKGQLVLVVDSRHWIKDCYYED